ncbi:TonB-dependent receptor plug domain-containing protein [Pseudoalteromonas sp. SSDWG2]|uniref:TonB-dependent receptor plug domain-containing protein n=1 Tax=Pseudoalteromonas sp. SSDWG2 TaxID=3139391 RepID=UPI003BAD0D7B
MYSLTPKHSKTAISYLVTLILGSVIATNHGHASQPEDDLFSMSLEQLSKVKVRQASTLTNTVVQRIPASVTRISKEMIANTPARDLDELLEMYVPNLQLMKHGGSGQHIGIRGIISDLDNKFLVVVNGQVMNNKETFGAISERYMPFLGDIDYIEVVRGPGSVLYGAGAISGVINIKTLSSHTHKGVKIAAKAGFIEEYQKLEFKYGGKVTDELGFFAYIGLSHYDGADPDDAPLVFSRDGDFYSAGQRNTSDFIVNDNSTLFDTPLFKMHFQLDWENTELWLRSTKGSWLYDNARHFIDREGSFEGSGRGIVYVQTTAGLSHDYTIADDLTLTVNATAEIFDTGQHQYRLEPKDGPYTLVGSEHEWSIDSQLNWVIDANNELAMALRYERGFYNRNAQWLDTDNLDRDSYSTDTLSMTGEYQTLLSEDWTLFLGGRLDKHSIAGSMFSPRLSLVRATQEQQLKLIYNRGVRRSDERILRQQKLTNTAPDIEQIDMAEIRYDWHTHLPLSYAVVAFYYEHELLGFLPQAAGETQIGEIIANGIEFEMSYKTDAHTFGISHAYTNLIDFELKSDDLRNQVYSSEPYGYGDDLANWSVHYSKLNWQWTLSENLNINNLLRYYWGYPGAEDYTAYNNQVLQAFNRGLSDGRTDAFDASVFWDIGGYYRINNTTRLSFELHNALGWFDKSLNKRNFYARQSGYRLEAAAVSVGIDVSF